MGWIYRNLILQALFYLMQIPLKKNTAKCFLLNSLDQQQLEAYQLRKLKILVGRKNNYAEYIQHLVVNSKSIKEALSYIPIMTKKELQAWTATLEGVPSTMMRETAGTTGSPMRFWYAKLQIARQLAVRSYCLKMLGINYGEREARFWGRRDNSKKSKIRNWLLNRKVFNFIDGDASQSAKMLIKYGPSYIYGYSSIVLEAARYFDNNQLSPPDLKAIICTAESLQPFQQDYIEQVFKCPVVMEYGCTEVDIIAFQCKLRHYHLVNPWLIVEVGECRTLVTDLNQDIMPIVRYEVGDDVAYETLNKACKAGPGQTIIKEITGRSLQQKVYMPDGSSVHAVIFAYIAEEVYQEAPIFNSFFVRQVCFDKFIFYVDLKLKSDDEAVRLISRKLSELYEKYSGFSAHFDVHFEIPITVKERSKFDYFTSDLDGSEKLGKRLQRSDQTMARSS